MGETAAEFERRAIAFLESNAVRKVPGNGERWGVGPDEIGVLQVHRSADEERRLIEEARAWRHTVFDAGFGWIGGPADLGGGGGDPAFDEIFQFLEGQFDVPDQHVFTTASHLVGPAIMAWGSSDLQRHYMPGLMRGDLLACQLLSEPEAGSDLAGLRTTAVLDGDEWVINGQKVWSSFAHMAHVGQLMCRTEPDQPKHAALSMLLIGMQAPGVQVRPIRQMNGESHFCEVFLDNVRAPAGNIVGERGQGWKVLSTTLASERASVGNGTTTANYPFIPRLFDLARHAARASDPVIRQLLAEVHTHHRLIQWTNDRLNAEAGDGHDIGPRGSLLKLIAADQMVRIPAIAAQLLGPSITADSGEWGTYAWANMLLGAPCQRIAGGTDEIQRNIVAERLLGLPREPRTISNATGGERT